MAFFKPILKILDFFHFFIVTNYKKLLAFINTMENKNYKQPPINEMYIGVHLQADLDFDAFKPPNISQEQIYNWIKPSFLEHNIAFNYSKEVEYFKEIQDYKTGWDSYDGYIPKPESIQGGIDFLASFTKELKKTNILLSTFPEFCLASDGILGFEWDYAKNSNLFARIYTSQKIECILTTNNKKQPPQEITSEKLIEICKEKLQPDKVA